MPKPTVTIGLDIGSHSIKCVELERLKDKVTLLQARVTPLGEQTLDNLTALLKPFADIVALAPESVRVVLSGSSLLVRCISMPHMTAKELKSAIRFEAENHIAFPIDDCVLDFQILNENPEKKTMNVLLVAAKRDFIQERLRMMMDAGVNAEVIDVDTFSLVNAFELLNAVPEEPVCALLNIGHHVSSFAILDGKLPLFVREIPIGGVAVTKALAETKNISEVEAEKLKIQRSAETLEDLKAATRHGLETLVESVKQSLAFYENQSGKTLKSVWLSGGGALAVSSQNILSEGLGKEVALWDATKKLELAPAVEAKFLETQAPLLNVAFGLALRD